MDIFTLVVTQMDLAHLSGSQNKTKKTKDIDVGKGLGRKNLERGRW